MILLFTLFAAAILSIAYLHHPPITRQAIVHWQTIGRSTRAAGRKIGVHLIPRKHRRMIHFGILGVIAHDYAVAGAKLADLGFLALSALIELEDAETSIAPMGERFERNEPTIDATAETAIATWESEGGAA